MTDILIGLTKSSIFSLFSVKKLDREILDEDLKRIMLIRNLIEEGSDFIKNNCDGINVNSYNSELNQYACDLFIEFCLDEIPEENRRSDDFDITKEIGEIKEYFDYIYANLKYPK